MSTYENYTHISTVYDHTRVPLGLDIITAVLSSGPKAIEQQVLLDAGCGTGVYSAALVEQVGRIEAVDLNAAMLAVARSKMHDAVNRGRVRFWQASIGALPLENASVDSVMINQVLHHLPDRAEDGWPAHRQVLVECERVLKPGGMLIINSCGHVQLSRGFWFYRLIPSAVAAVMDKVIPLNDLENLIRDSGLVFIARQVDLDGVLQGQAYFRAEGVLDDDWRRGDSIWRLVTDPELDAVLGRVNRLMASGELQTFMRQWDADRLEVGQTSFTVARKSGSHMDSPS